MCPRDPEYMAPFKFIDVNLFYLYTRSLSLVKKNLKGGTEARFRATASFLNKLNVTLSKITVSYPLP